jgi:hypothetical protein
MCWDRDRYVYVEPQPLLAGCSCSVNGDCMSSSFCTAGICVPQQGALLLNRHVCYMVGGGETYAQAQTHTSSCSLA